MNGKKKKPLSKKTKTVVLDEPVQWGDELVSEIELGPLKGRHIKGLSSQMKLGDILNVAASASDYPKSFFEDLDASDANKVVEAISDLL